MISGSQSHAFQAWMEKREPFNEEDSIKLVGKTRVIIMMRSEERRVGKECL